MPELTGQITHIAGLPIRVDQRLRQRCGWCGALIDDWDLENTMVETGRQTEAPPTWEVGALIVVDGNATWQDPNDDGPLPDNACAKLDPAVTR